ncbi:hypothetical protein JW979_05205, partial [bacterium]|nr:hypothetical protein [candidate division CSSED10-310 bacterium]
KVVISFLLNALANQNRKLHQTYFIVISCKTCLIVIIIMQYPLINPVLLFFLPSRYDRMSHIMLRIQASLS